MRGLTLFLVIITLLVYVIIGGVIFHFVESRSEEESRITAVGARERVLANNTCLTVEELDSFIKVLQAAQSAGVSLSGNQTSESNWDVASSIFFATTVATTIGYGNISPSTTGGRVFCVFFACVGIPLFLVATANLAEKLKSVIFKCVAKGTKCKPGKLCENTLKCLALLLSALMFLFLPSLLFHLVETDWSYGDSLYYSFVTLTTIGFGDYVAGQDSVAAGRVVYRLFVAVWILLGLTWMATLIAFVQEAFSSLVEKEDDRATGKTQNNSKIYPNEKGDASLRAENESAEPVTKRVEHDTDSAEAVTGSPVDGNTSKI